MITKSDIAAYHELNEKRDSENLAGWSERLTHWNNIRIHLTRDLRKTGVTECVLCHKYLDDGYVHEDCLDKAVRYRESVNKESERFLYVLYKHERMVYIGITMNPRARFKEHLNDKNVDSMTVFQGGSSTVIEASEKREIHKHHPALNNRLHNADGSQFLARDMLVRRFSFLDAKKAIDEVSGAFDLRAKQRITDAQEAMQTELDACRARIEFLEAQLMPVVPDTPELLEEPW
ncbi:GIY-YIG nuclease family protein [Streptomyces antibioticus]|uniref:GIY-YIG nuclease family protein n=1 Tax=Streptomyces antibioticus TaxID=1890 RepID=UPI0036FC3757